MYAQADSDHWRKKYFDALKSIEQEERAFRSLENVLRRLVGRLCLASLGQSPRLDVEVNRLAVALRNQAPEAELERLFAPLSEAIADLDQQNTETTPASGPSAVQVASNDSQISQVVTTHVVLAPAVAPVVTVVAAAAPAVAPTVVPAVPAVPAVAPTAAPASTDVFGDSRIRAILSRLLDLIRQDNALQEQASDVSAQLAVPLTTEQLPLLLSDIADLVNRRVVAVEREKRDIEGLLGQITGRLDELTQFMLGENAERKMSLESTQEFNTRLVSDMHELGSSVAESVDLVQVKLKVRTRLDTISEQVQEFRAREDERARSHFERSEKMRERVERLEGEARNLHDRLRDEQRLAMIDALTQIPNRLSYDQRLTEEFKRWQRFNQPTCIATWDIDFFKKINDAYGHRAGDKVLRIVAECLAGRIRETDFIARYGGEEFVMILAGTGLDDAFKVAEQMRESVTKLGFHFRGVPVTVSVSCGITAFREGDNADDAFDRADKALYQAKADGRNRCVVG